MRALTLGICVLFCGAATGCIDSASNPATGDDSGGDDSGAPDATQDSPHPADDGGVDGGARDGSGNASEGGPGDATTGGPGDAGSDGATDGATDGAAACPPPPQDAGTYGNAVLADSPLAYWRFDETSGITAHDSSGHCVDGTYKGPITYGAAGALMNDSDTAISMNGGGTYVDMGDVFSFDNLAPFSLEMWARPAVVNTEYRGLISKDWQPADMSNRQGYVFFQMVSAGTGFERYQNFISEGAYCAPDGGAPGSGGCSESGNWVHLVATFDGGNMNLYENGVLIGGPTYSPQLIQPTAGCSFVVGALFCGTVGFFSGDVDEVAVYGTALSPARIQEHYAAAHQ